MSSDIRKAAILAVVSIPVIALAGAPDMVRVMAAKVSIQGADPAKKPGIEFLGPAADALYDALPEVSWGEGYLRFVMIQDGEHALTLNCRKGTQSEGASKVAYFPDGTHCEIAITKADSDQALKAAGFKTIAELTPLKRLAATKLQAAGIRPLAGEDAKPLPALARGASFRFSGGAAHRFNQLLARVSGGGELRIQSTKDKEELVFQCRGSGSSTDCSIGYQEIKGAPPARHAEPAVPIVPAPAPAPVAGRQATPAGAGETMLACDLDLGVHLYDATRPWKGDMGVEDAPLEIAKFTAEGAAASLTPAEITGGSLVTGKMGFVRKTIQLRFKAKTADLGKLKAASGKGYSFPVQLRFQSPGVTSFIVRYEALAGCAPSGQESAVKVWAELPGKPAAPAKAPDADSGSGSNDGAGAADPGDASDGAAGEVSGE